MVAEWVLSSPQREDRRPAARNYQAWGSQNIVFLLGGRFRYTRGRPVSVATGVLMLVPLVLFCVFEASWFWHERSPAVVVLFGYCWAVAFASFVRAAVSDPGSVARNTHLVEDGFRLPDDYCSVISLPSAGGGGRAVEVKYCATCKVWRSPRTFHCVRCDQCVEGHDHHCKWLNNCVGARNYGVFYGFLVFGNLSCAYYVTCSFYHLFSVSRTQFGSDFRRCLNHIPMSLVNGVLGVLLWVYPLLLLAYHTYFALTQQTTREFIRRLKASERSQGPSSFDLGLARNFVSFVCRPSNATFASVKQRELYRPGDFRFERFELADLRAAA